MKSDGPDPPKAGVPVYGDGAGDAYRCATVVSFATADFREQQLTLGASALKVGIDYVSCWNEERLKDEAFFRSHFEIFKGNAGARHASHGYFLWKPYLIKHELTRLRDQDFLVYWDVGREAYPNRFEISPRPLLDWCAKYNRGMLPGVYLPQHGPNRFWTKRDCFVAMGCDAPEYWEHPQVQATFSVWQKTPEAIAFVDEWLRFCDRPEILTDQPNRLGLPNLDGFVAHRHDQSVLTNLVIRRGLKCFGDTATRLPGNKDLNNLVDAVCDRHDRIIRRERRKIWAIRLAKTRDPDWWSRNIKWGLSLPLIAAGHYPTGQRSLDHS